MDLGTTTLGGVIAAFAISVLIYGLHNRTILVIGGWPLGGMKLRVKEPGSYWFGVCQWSLASIIGSVLVVAGFFKL